MFKDRNEAGNLLVPLITALNLSEPVVIGIPRGGSAVAYPVARALKVKMYVILTRKIGAPFDQEYAIGAVAPDGSVALNEKVVKELGIRHSDLESIIAVERAEIERRSVIYGKFAVLPDMKGKDIILVDDGIATGFTIKAAVSALKKLNPRSLNIAVPVLPADAVKKFSELASHLIYLDAPEYFMSVSQFYMDFPQTTHDQVLDLLKEVEETLGNGELL
jgi:putative phosphoribosyl transferase